VILLHRQNEENPELPTCLVDVIIEKNRNGPRGKFQLLFEKRFMTFRNYAQDGT
jgi:replicative DNA helicase